MNRLVALLVGGDGSLDVVDTSLDDLNHFLETSSSGNDGANSFLTLWFRLEDVVKAGGGDSNKLHMDVVDSQDCFDDGVGRAALIVL